jgi:hypothetical protein
MVNISSTLLLTEISDDEDEGTLPENLKPEPILELTVRKIIL